jgi:hypothetical protein
MLSNACVQTNEARGVMNYDIAYLSVCRDCQNSRITGIFEIEISLDLEVVQEIEKFPRSSFFSVVLENSPK